MSGQRERQHSDSEGLRTKIATEDTDVAMLRLLAPRTVLPLVDAHREETASPLLRILVVLALVLALLAVI